MRTLTPQEMNVVAGVASEAVFDSIADVELRALRADEEVVNYRYVPTSLIERASSSDVSNKGPVEHVASTEEQDRMGDRILLAGWQLKTFRKNPVLLFGHQSGMLPVGRVVKIGRGFTPARVRAHVSKSTFHANLSEHAKLVERYVRARELPAVSVGFRPIEIHWPKSPEEREKLGLGRHGILFRKQELVELSVVTVPANASALMKSFDDGVAAGEFPQVLVDEFRAAVPLDEKAWGDFIEGRVREFLERGGAAEEFDDVEEAEEFDDVAECDGERFVELTAEPGEMAVATIKAVDALADTVRLLVDAQTAHTEALNTLGETVESLRDIQDYPSRGAGGASLNAEPNAEPGDGEEIDLDFGGEVLDLAEELKQGVADLHTSVRAEAE